MSNCGNIASRVYEMVLWAAIFGLTGTNALRLIFSQTFSTEDVAIPFQPASPATWYFGTLGGLLYAAFLLPRLRMDSSQAEKSLAEPASLNPEPVSSPHARLEHSEPETLSFRQNPMKRLSDAGGVSLIGGVVGTYFGVGLLIMWLWVAASPLMPSRLGSSDNITTERQGRSEIRRPALAINRSITISLVGLPIVVGMIAGFAGRTIVVSRMNDPAA